MTTPIIYLKNIFLTFGGKFLFTDVELQIYKGDKISLIGRNGSGKSSLLKIIEGSYDFDKGERYISPGASIKYLNQMNLFDNEQTIYEYLSTEFKDNDLRSNLYKIDIIIDKLNIDGNENINKLSGGKLRRVALAQTLISQPDILLLDEPTNHLDIESIEWLEDYIKTYNGALVCISHDRQFLKNISTKMLWLDRGKIKTLNKGFEFFEEWTETSYETEERELHKLSKKLDDENMWLQKGVTARRKRNQGRLKDLFLLREKLQSDKTNFSKLTNKVNFSDVKNDIASKVIIDIKNLTYSYQQQDIKIIDNLSAKIVKGEKIAFIGKNGSGKTSLVKLIIGQLFPKNGAVKLGKNIKISYFDQKRESLNNNDTILQIMCPVGGDTIFVDGKAKHIISYMRDFLFDQDKLNSPVSSLSGGEANRLLLAKILADPGNLLILDEPTNDLDMETLDLLEEMLSNYNGTLIIVSHDRDFLSRIVTRSLIFENNKIIDYIGSYIDYNRQKINNNKSIKLNRKKTIIKNKESNNKLSYKYIRELEMLPKIIADIENNIKTMENELSNPNLYINDIVRFKNLSIELSIKKSELSKAEDRWLELDEMNS